MDVHCQQWEHGIKKQQWWYKTNNNGDMSLDMDGILMGHISNLIWYLGENGWYSFQLSCLSEILIVDITILGLPCFQTNPLPSGYYVFWYVNLGKSTVNGSFSIASLRAQQLWPHPWSAHWMCRRPLWRAARVSVPPALHRVVHGSHRVFVSERRRVRDMLLPLLQVLRPRRARVIPNGPVSKEATGQPGMPNLTDCTGGSRFESTRTFRCGLCTWHGSATTVLSKSTNAVSGLLASTG